MQLIDLFYKKLCETTVNRSGHIKISLGGVESIISGKDAVGHLMQEWLYDWSVINGFLLSKNSSTQSFPDYYLKNTRTGESSLLEIKNFNYDAAPAFDVADFYAFIENLPLDPSKLYADYIIFGYTLDNIGNLIIPKIYKRKIWEIVGPSVNHITCQIRGKRMVREIDEGGRIQKIRPFNFKLTEYPGFDNEISFIDAIQKLLNTNRNTINLGYSNWSEKVKSKLQKIK